MSILLFYLLFLVLTADGLMVFLTPVVVYMLTGSIEYAGLSYAIWWLPRLILIPLIGNLIDDIGVRPLSIFSDCIKIAGCLFLIISNFQDPLMIAIAFGVVGSMVSIGNSQTMITYEKIIAVLSRNKEHHVNIMSRVDFLGMIIGPVIGMMLIDFGYKYLLIAPCVFYLINAVFFTFSSMNFDSECINSGRQDEISVKIDSDVRFASFRFIMSTPLLISIIGLAIGNNMFDGLVESSGTALIDKVMALPVKYFGFVDVSAGICGLIGTYIYSVLLKAVSRERLLLLGLCVIILPSLILVRQLDSFLVFVLCYSLTIIGKVITGNINRITRIEVIPTRILASTSSIVVLLCQSVLPVVGALLFLFGDERDFVSYLMIVAIFTSLFSGIAMSILIKKNRAENMMFDS